MRRILFCLAVVAFTADWATADPIIFTGSDPGVGPGGARPNSNAARNSFLAAVAGGNPQTINFDALPLGFTNPLAAAPGVSVAFSGMDGGSSGIIAGGDAILGYDTTLGGAGRFLRIAPNFNAIGDAVFNFTDPISAFGAFFTGVGTAGGGVHIVFNDGSARDYGLTGNASGGVLFFGFTDFGTSISSVTVRSLPAPGTRDIIGVDDVTFASEVPEPATMAIFGGLALAGLVGCRRRKPATV